jgi:hypothetical protein
MSHTALKCGAVGAEEDPDLEQLDGAWVHSYGAGIQKHGVMDAKLVYRILTLARVAK